MEPQTTGERPYPVSFSVEYPDRELNRVSTFFRIFAAIPILIIVALLTGGGSAAHWGAHSPQVIYGTSGIVFLPTVLMILFRQKYPRWWFDWNLELMRFFSRVGIYIALMDDRYPSTEEHQSVRLDFAYPDAQNELNRWLPLVKWILAIPHFILLGLLSIAVFFVVLFAWFAILFTGRYPRSLFEFVEGVTRWYIRVTAYAITLVTDRYPPFSLSA